MAETDTIKSPKGGILLHYGGQCMHVQPFSLLLPAIYIYIAPPAQVATSDNYHLRKWNGCTS